MSKKDIWYTVVSVLIITAAGCLTSCKEAAIEEPTTTTIVTTEETSYIKEETTTEETTIDIYSKSIEQLAEEVIAGVYGKNDERKALLGDRYDEVQSYVDELLSPQSTEASFDSNSPDSGDDSSIYSIAWNTYGISEYDVNKCLKLITYEGYGDDSYLDYLMACTCVNRLVDNPGCELYSYWGGNDGSYGPWMDSLGIADHAYSALYSALIDLDRNAWDCHGMVPENGYYSGCQWLEESMYYTIIGDMYFAVWDRSAPWH